MAFFTKKTKVLSSVLIALTTSLLAYNNCSNKTFSISNESMQRLLSDSSSIYINNNDTYTNNNIVNLSLENNSAKEMYITNTTDCADGGNWEPYSSSKVWTLAQTNSRAKVFVKYRETQGGVESNCTWDSIIHDNIAPNLAIVNGVPTITNSHDVSFQFSSNDNLSGVKGYKCKDSKGQSLANCQETMTLTGVAEGPGSVNVFAEDNAGNVSAPLVQSWLADFTAPKIAINSAPSAISNQMNGAFSFSGTDNFSPSLKFECRINSGAFAQCQSPYNFNLNEGTFVFEVRAIDNAGNISTPATYNWVIDLSAPTVRILSGPNPFANSPSATFTFDGMDNGSPITKFDCKMDSGAFVSCGSPSVYSALTNGNHVFQVRGYDNAGNTSAPASFSWVVDTKPPQVTITAMPPKSTNQTTAVFQYTSVDAETGIHSTECQLDNGAYQSCSNPVSFSNLPQGNHTFYVRAIDLAGNISPVASYAWFVDLTPPVLQFIRTPNNPTNLAQAIFEMQATDNSPGSVSLECLLDTATLFTPCSKITTLTMTSDGVHNFSVRGVDTAGNISAPLSYSWLLDTTGPAISFTQIPKSSNLVTDTITVAFSVTDSLSTTTSIKCGLQGAQQSSCPAVTSVSYNNLTSGTYIYSVTAVDSLGNSSTNSIQWDMTGVITPIHQTVTVTQNNKADILIVIDNSGSMKTEQANMAARFSTFIDQLNGLDWRIGIVTTDVSSNAYKKDGRFLIFDKTAFTANGVTPPDFYFIDSTMDITAAKNSFGKTIQRPANEGSGDEQGIAASYRAILRSKDPTSIVDSDPNRAFFRSDAVLSVLVVTDANESNPKGTQTQNNPANWVNTVQTTWPSKAFNFNSIIVKSGDSACLAINGNEAYGTSYEQLSSMTGGVIGTVCASDYGSQLTQMGKTVVNLTRKINLLCPAVDQNQNGNIMDDILVTLQGGSNAPVASVSGSVLTLVNDLPTGTHALDYWCLQ